MTAAGSTESLYEVSTKLNGRDVTFQVPAHRTLLDALRNELGQTGTKSCCTEGECGACIVLVDGQSVTSCLVLAVEAQGAEITTIEGISENGPTDLQEELIAKGAVQCGFCIPGQVMSATDLLARDPNPSVEVIREALSGNLCRCAGYNRIVEAVVATAQRRRHE
jgi:carbon-monoxide dehydrogenase small subunit